MTDNKIAVLAKRLKKLAHDYKANRLAIPVPFPTSCRGPTRVIDLTHEL
jgi:hypothetical protein